MADKQGLVSCVPRKDGPRTHFLPKLTQEGGRQYRRAVGHGEMVVQDEHGITDFYALRSAIHKAPHRLVFFAFDLLHIDGQDLRVRPLTERRALLRKLIRPDKRLLIQFSDHVEGDGATFFRAAAELGLEGIVSNRMASRYCSGPSRSWLKTKNMVERDLFPRQQTPAYAIRQVE